MPPLQTPFAGLGPSSDQLAINWGVLITPSSGLIICQKSSQNSGKQFTYIYQFNIKDTTQKEPNGRDAQGKVWGAGHEASMLAPGMLPSQHLNLEGSRNCSSFYSTPSPATTSLPGVQLVGLKVSILISWSVWLAGLQGCHARSPDQHKPRCDGKGLIMNKTLLSGNSKGFKSSVPGTRDKDQIYFCIILHHLLTQQPMSPRASPLQCFSLL